MLKTFFVLNVKRKYQINQSTYLVLATARMKELMGGKIVELNSIEGIVGQACKRMIVHLKHGKASNIGCLMDLPTTNDVNNPGMVNSRKTIG